MFVVRDARQDDATVVVPFLLDTLPGRNPRTYHFIFAFAQSRIGALDADTAGPLGAVLQRADGSIAGFLGVLASRQPHLTSGWVQHLTSWSVAPDARTQGLTLLHHVVRAHSGIVTNFSGTAAVQAILPRFGFAPVDDAELTFSALSLAGLRGRLGGGVLTGLDVIGLAADPEQARIVRQHLAMGCHAVAIDRNGRSVLAVMVRLGHVPRATAQLIHLFPADDDAIETIWPALKGLALYDMHCARIRVDARFAPRGEEPLVRKARQMLARGFSGRPRDLSRAFGEPLNGAAHVGSADFS